MAFWQARDFLFCGVCGTLLDFNSHRYASCPLCGFKRKAKGLLPSLSLPFSTPNFTPLRGSRVTEFLIPSILASGNPAANALFSADIEGKETRYAVTAEDIRRELKIKPFVVLESAPNLDIVVQRSLTERACPKCNHHELEYYTKQLRSADEGQTIFYECPECGHAFNENT
ncbi:DNA-directed RNA polymerase I subunit RPA12 [Hordeum vulgare]|nr:DNA-directed RNA polymerase I subunit RPA12 [Hordeum vulgare]